MKVFAKILVVFMACAGSFFASAEDLVRDGQALGVVVVPEGASQQLRQSSERLQEYIEKSTGAKLPIVTEAGDAPAIHLGGTELVKKAGLLKEDVGRDGFLLKRIDPKNFAIVGNTDWGTEFGVYDFLERYLGVRWLAATDLFTEVPKHDALALPDANIKEKPVFLSRELFPIDVKSDPNDKRRSSPPLWYNLYDQWGRTNRLLADVDFHHNLKELLPPSKFAQTNPEFYPFYEGKHVIPPDDNYFQWQPNFSAKGIVEASANEIIKYFEEHPEKQSYSLGLNDSLRFDESPESKARRNGKRNSINLEDISDDYYQWANEVAAEVHQKFPDKYFGLLAYLQVLEPPTRVKVSPYIVPYITYENTRWENPEYREKMQKVTLAWGEVAPTLGWYDYVYGSHYLIPRFFPRAEQQSLVWAAKHNVKYYYAEAIPAWGEGPNMWVLTKLLWNPNQDVDALLDDWYTAAVGKAAAPKLREYFEIWEKFWRDDIRSARWYSTTNLWHAFDNTEYLNAVPLAYLEKSDRLLDEAVAAAETPVQKERAEALRKIWKVYRASVIARQGDDLWKTANLQTDADAEAYLEKCKTAIRAAEERLGLMGDLVDDPLHGHTVFRATGTPRLGDEWGCGSLWSLLPWVNKNKNVREYLESLSARHGEEPLGYRSTYSGNVPMSHQAPEIARRILAASRGEAEQMLKNPSFENGTTAWSVGANKATTEKSVEGKASLRVQTKSDGKVVQFVPYKIGAYIAKVSVLGEGDVKKGKVSLVLTAFNDAGIQIGPHLPTASVQLTPGEWSTLVIPFTLAKYSIDATKLQVEVRYEGLPTGDVIYLDDLGVYRTDDKERKGGGAGPDGM